MLFSKKKEKRKLVGELVTIRHQLQELDPCILASIEKQYEDQVHTGLIKYKCENEITSDPDAKLNFDIPLDIDVDLVDGDPMNEEKILLSQKYLRKIHEYQHKFGEDFLNVNLHLFDKNNDGDYI